MPAASAPSSATAWNWLQAQLAGRPLPGALTLIGLGDVALLDALDEHAPGCRMLVLEPDAARGRVTLAAPRVDAWRRSGRLAYLIGPDYAGADQAWRIFPARFDPPPLMVHPASAGAPGLRAAVSVLAKIVFGAKSNADARRRFAPRYLLNSVCNLPDIMHGGDVRVLEGSAKGAAAIVVGAGPSLDASLDDLKQVAPHAVVVATDTSLRPLLAHGITPQFVVALDPSELNSRHLRDLPPCDTTWLIAESALEPRAVATFAGRTLWFRVAPHQPWPWLNQLGIDVGRLEVWGSVLTAGYQIAALAGCDPIVMVGADLSFPEGRPYVRGTTYELDWAWAAAFGTPVEETWRALLAGRKDLRVEKDVTGTDTQTTSVMLEFRDWLVAQAARSGRRVVNATGRGLLSGAGVIQTTLADALRAQSQAGARFDRAARSNARHAATLVKALERPPIPEWQEFSGDGFDAAKLQDALDSVCGRLNRGIGDAPPAFPPQGVAPDLARLPEDISRLRSALRGEALVPAVDMPAGERSRLLSAAFDLLHAIVARVAQGADFTGFPHPDQIEGTPAAAGAQCPEDLRPVVLRFEGLLGRAWAQGGSRPATHDRLATVLPDDAWSLGASHASGAPIYAMHACTLLVVEWLRCVASADAHARDALQGVVDRLWTLEGVLRTEGEWQRPRTRIAVVIDAPWTAASQLVLPLHLSVEALWGLRAGTGGCIARSDGSTPVCVSLRMAGAALVPAPDLDVIPIVPRRVEWAEWPRLKVAGHAVGGALCIAPGTPATVLVDAEGCVTPYQTWPRAITGGLSLGDAGEVAWYAVSGAKPGAGRPYLMYRPSPAENVQVIPLPFRPASGVWWRGRLYMNCLPTESTAGGVGSWAPGEAPVLRCPHLPLQGLVSTADGLHLEPYTPVAGKGIGRWCAAGVNAWTWEDERTATRRQLGALGAASASASSHGWTAAAYPQADIITATGPDGRVRHLHCYFPIRLAWAGHSLVVSAATRDLLVFERLASILGASA